MEACAHCGRELPSQGKFCPSCGKPRMERSATPTAGMPSGPAGGGAAAQPRNPAGDALSAITNFLRSLSRWDAAALLGGGLGSALWYGWSAMDVKDTVTPRYILLIPVFIIVFRKPLDALLRPLQAVKQHIPRLVLVGAGLAAPYFLAQYFYRHGVSNFPLAQKSIIWGTMLSYVIMRIPTRAHPVDRMLSRVPNRPATFCWFCIGFGLSLMLQEMMTVSAWADDFSHDYRRLEDGLRTDGWAQTIAGTAATVINGLVNGALVFQKPTSDTNQNPEEPPVNYTMDVRTEDERTTLAADGQDRLWVYGQISCSDPKVDTQALTTAIQFAFDGTYASWMSIATMQSTGGYNAVQLAANPPTPDDELPEDASVTVLVSGATAQGEPIQVPVTISLQPEPDMNIEVLS